MGLLVVLSIFTFTAVISQHWFHVDAWKKQNNPLKMYVLYLNCQLSGGKSFWVLILFILSFSRMFSKELLYLWN